MNDRAIIRYGATFGLAGSVLAIVANLLHPRTSDSGVGARFELIADSGIWDLVHYLAAAAVILALAGFVALDRFLRGKKGEPWARLGLIAAIVSAAVGIVLISIDGWALKTLADEWAEAGRPADGAIFAALNATEQVTNAIFNAFIGSLIGVTPVLVGIAIYQSGLFPRWTGIVAVASGALGIVVDFVQTMGEITNLTGNVLFPIAALGVTLSSIVVTWTMLRATTEPATVEASSSLA